MTERKTLNNAKLDKMWRELVYKRAGYVCEYCGKSETLNAHHIFSKSNHSVRWDIDNGICVCVSHHIFGNQSFHKSPIEMLEWIKEKRGRRWYDGLRSRAQEVMKPQVARELYFDILGDLNG